MLKKEYTLTATDLSELLQCSKTSARSLIWSCPTHGTTSGNLVYIDANDLICILYRNPKYLKLFYSNKDRYEWTPLYDTVPDALSVKPTIFDLDSVISILKISRNCAEKWRRYKILLSTASYKTHTGKSLYTQSDLEKAVQFYPERYLKRYTEFMMSHKTYIEMIETFCRTGGYMCKT